MASKNVELILTSVAPVTYSTWKNKNEMRQRDKSRRQAEISRVMSLKYQGVERPICKVFPATSFQCGMTFRPLCLTPERWSCSREQSTVGCFHELCFLHTLSGRIGKVVASHAAVARSIPMRCTDLYYARGAQGVLPMRVGGATSQLDLPSLTPLSVADCG